MKNHKVFITCPVLKNELSESLPSNPETDIITLKYSIHHNPNVMKEELTAAVSKAKK
jgi:hypothetical protein